MRNTYIALGSLVLIILFLWVGFALGQTSSMSEAEFYQIIDSHIAHAYVKLMFIPMPPDPPPPPNANPFIPVPYRQPRPTVWFPLPYKIEVGTVTLHGEFPYVTGKTREEVIDNLKTKYPQMFINGN